MDNLLNVPIIEVIKRIGILFWIYLDNVKVIPGDNGSPLEVLENHIVKVNDEKNGRDSEIGHIVALIAVVWISIRILNVLKTCEETKAINNGTKVLDLEDANVVQEINKVFENKDIVEKIVFQKEGNIERIWRVRDLIKVISSVGKDANEEHRNQI